MSVHGAFVDGLSDLISPDSFDWQPRDCLALPRPMRAMRCLLMPDAQHQGIKFEDPVEQEG